MHQLLYPIAMENYISDIPKADSQQIVYGKAE